MYNDDLKIIAIQLTNFYVDKFWTITYYNSIIGDDFMCSCCHMKLNGIGFSHLFIMPSISEVGQVSKQFWVSVLPLKNGRNSIFL